MNTRASLKSLNLRWYKDEVRRFIAYDYVSIIMSIAECNGDLYIEEANRFFASIAKIAEKLNKLIIEPINTRPEVDFFVDEFHETREALSELNTTCIELITSRKEQEKKGKAVLRIVQVDIHSLFNQLFDKIATLTDEMTSNNRFTEPLTRIDYPIIDTEMQVDILLALDDSYAELDKVKFTKLFDKYLAKKINTIKMIIVSLYINRGTVLPSFITMDYIDKYYREGKCSKILFGIVKAQSTILANLKH